MSGGHDLCEVPLLPRFARTLPAPIAPCAAALRVTGAGWQWALYSVCGAERGADFPARSSLLLALVLLSAASVHSCDFRRTATIKTWLRTRCLYPRRPSPPTTRPTSSRATA